MATKEVSKKRKVISTDRPDSTKAKPPKTKVQKVETSADVKKKQNGSKHVSKTTVKKSMAEPSTQETTKKNEQNKVSPASSHAEDEQDAENDHTAELLDGFSSFSESEPEENDKISNDAKAKPVPSAPSTATTLTKKASDLKSPAHEPKKQDPNEARGTLYIGRIPHGFYEHQLRAYFSQFGAITNLRLSRNRRTGASKHYGFLEFESQEVARIVAETMDNYLLFGHILQVKVIEQEKVPENIWRGANRRFKKVPWNGIERGRLRSADREAWGKRVSREEGRRKRKLEKMKSLGYEFEVPGIRQVDSVPVREKENKGVEQGKVVEDKGVRDEAAPKHIEQVKDAQSDLKQLLKGSDNAEEQQQPLPTVVQTVKTTVNTSGVEETTKTTTVADAEAGIKKTP
ncbi:MAG: hypothetical protein M1831_003254 [Alyxoria varia]|nr:MAG: hypothetical protein M1831_003254 [Alyxoria varia]